MKRTPTAMVRSAIVAIALLFAGAASAMPAPNVLSPFSYSADSYEAGATTTYTFSYRTATTLPEATYVRVFKAQFPSDFTIPADLSISDFSVTVDGSAKTLNFGGKGSDFVLATLSESVPAGSDVVVTVARITNPSSAGSYNFGYVGTADGGNNLLDTPTSIDPVSIIDSTPSYTLTYTAGDHGSLTGDTSQTVTEGDDGSEVTAVPDDGYHFVNWSDDSTDNPRADYSISGDINVTANFELSNQTYTLQYHTGDHGSLTGNTDQEVTYGNDGTEVTAVPDEGYHFASWSDDSEDNPRIDTSVSQNINVTAIFLPYASTLVTNGSVQIGSFPVGMNISNTSWNIDTTSSDATEITSAAPDFVGPSDATLSDMTGWTTAFTGDEDDDSVEIPLGYSTDFNTSSYSSVFIGSNTYFTFGEGSSHYYNLAANNPPFPGVHMCAGDHSYQRVFYKLDDADTMRVRYEGTNETSGTEGEPNIVYEALFHKNSSTINLYMGVNAGCIDPSNQSYTLHYSAGAHGSLTGNDNQTVAYGADGSEITAVPDEGYHFTKWSDDSTNNPRTDQSVSENIDVTANFELIPESADEVWVDDDYNSGNTGSHTWETDAFDNIPDAINAVSENGTVHVSAGIYDSTSPITINKKIDLVGPGVAEVAEANRAILINTDNGDDPAYCSGIRKLLVVLSIEASYTHVSGFEITSECNAAPVVRVGTSSNPVEGVVSVENVVIDDNEISGGQHGISVRHDTESTTISNNIIHGALDPNYHSWGKGGITLGSSPNNQIFGNNIYENYNGITMYYGGEESWIDGQFGETEIYNNNIHNNRNAGIYFSATDQADTMTIGPDNEITENADGIYVSGNAHNVLINGNQIYSNTNPRSALHVENASTGLDATENWWGDESGPYEENNNSAATGDAISIENSDFIYFRPFCLDEGCENMSSYPVDADNLTSLFSNGGTMTVPEGEDQNDVSEINVREDTIISVETGSGTTKITLPAGTIITRSDDSNFNIGDLSASGIELSSLSGFDTGITVAGAVQWGIPDLGLSFNQPIKIDLYVGTDLSGQTLAIRRSSSMDSGWTDDGIVAPGTCVVSSEGICSFETTKASYYSALDGITQDDNNNNDDNTSQKDTAQKAHIKSWNASLVTDLSSCPEKIKLNLTGKHFKDSSDVRIGGHKADWMDVKYSNKLSAKFCLADLLSGRPASSRTVSVKNPDTDTEKADKKIDLSQFIPSSDNTLASPQSSEDVKSIQRELNKLGLLDESSITGIYGPLTTEAVKKFQADNGLPTTGFVGPLTRAKLEEKTK